MYVRLFVPWFDEIIFTAERKALLVTISKTWATRKISIDNNEMTFFLHARWWRL